MERVLILKQPSMQPEAMKKKKSGTIQAAAGEMMTPHKPVSLKTNLNKQYCNRLNTDER